MRATCDCILFRRRVLVRWISTGLPKRRGRGREREREINSRNKGAAESGSDRYSSQTSYNSAEERWANLGEREREREREYLNYMGLVANVFGPVYEMMLFIKIHETRRFAPLLPVPASAQRNKKNQCELTRWRNVPIRAIFIVNVNKHCATRNKKGIKSTLMSRSGVYYPALNGGSRQL
jgi:hypothetical protein